jgi:hypothetical protein
VTDDNLFGSDDDEEVVVTPNQSDDVKRDNSNDSGNSNKHTAMAVSASRSSSQDSATSAKSPSGTPITPVTPEDNDDNLFGSDDDNDDDDNADDDKQQNRRLSKVGASKQNSQSSTVSTTVSTASDNLDAILGFSEKSTASGANKKDYSKFCLPLPYDFSNSTAYYLRTPNFIKIQTQSFDVETHDEMREQDERAKFGKATAVIRWRFKRDGAGKMMIGPDGRPLKESNAKLVKWSDGSLMCIVGGETFKIETPPLQNRYVRDVNLLSYYFRRLVRTVIECFYVAALPSRNRAVLPIQTPAQQLPTTTADVAMVVGKRTKS